MSEAVIPPDGDLLTQARRFAALSGPFEPGLALSPGSAEPPKILALAATSLAEECDTQPAGEGEHWVLRSPTRRFVLKQLAESGGLTEAIAARRSRPADAETEDLLAALQGAAPFDRAAVQHAIDQGGPRGMLERVVAALDRAGEVAPSYDLLTAARSALAALDRKARRERLQERGFVGREDEVARIAAWLTGPPAREPVKCVFVAGPPGIGKSAVLEAAVRRAAEAIDPILLRLDFDRAGLDVLDRRGLTLEAARQVGERSGVAGVDLIKARLLTVSQASTSPSLEIQAQRSTPRALVAEIARTLAGRRLFVVLDTLEVLPTRGATKSDDLFQWLDDLVGGGVDGMVVVGAGRGGALDGSPGRIAARIDLEELDRPDRRLFLELKAVDPRSWKAIESLAGGHPLKLRLAAEIARRAPDGVLPSRAAGRDVSAAYLYRFLLSRIDDPDLRKLAYPGLIVRRLDAAVIAEVLAPRLGLGRISADRAQQLFEGLRDQHWLMEPDYDAPGFLKHRSDMRALLLPLLYKGMGHICARLDRAAAEWFARGDEPWREVEAAYHRLQLMRRRSADPPTLTPAVASQIDEQMLSELPPAAQDVVRRARGGAGAYAGGMTKGSAPSPQLVDDLLALIARQDWREADLLLARVQEDGPLDPASEAADAMRAVHWRSGRWAQVKASLAARDRVRRGDPDLSDLRPELALARLEMRAELDPKRLLAARGVIRERGPALLEEAQAAPDNLARQGALAMLLAGEPDLWSYSSTRRDDVDLAAAIVALSQRRGGDASARDGREPSRQLGMALGVATERARGKLRYSGEPPPPDDPVDTPHDGRLLATLTPYAALASNLVTLKDDVRRLTERTEAFRDWLFEPGGLFPSEDRTPARSDRDCVAAVADLGLFAEWAGAVAFFWKDTELRHLAEAAETWRRAAAGEWAYAAEPPEGWTQVRPDETLALRIWRLTEGPDPVEAAEHELAGWCRLQRGHVDFPPADARRLARRLLGLLGAPPLALAAEPPWSAGMAQWMRRRRVPAAFIPAMAVLVTHGFTPDREETDVR